MSPLPTSFSAPGWSRMTRLSVRLRHGEGHAGRDVGLDDAGDDVDGRPLGGDDQVDADGAGLLGDAGDGLLDVAGGDHHQVVELVDDDDDVRQPLELRRLDVGGHGLGRRCSSPRSNAAL